MHHVHAYPSVNQLHRYPALVDLPVGHNQVGLRPRRSDCPEHEQQLPTGGQRRSSGHPDMHFTWLCQVSSHTPALCQATRRNLGRRDDSWVKGYGYAYAEDLALRQAQSKGNGDPLPWSAGDSRQR